MNINKDITNLTNFATNKRHENHNINAAIQTANTIATAFQNKELQRQNKTKKTKTDKYPLSYSEHVIASSNSTHSHIKQAHNTAMQP
jgi:hypothetical protein